MGRFLSHVLPIFSRPEGDSLPARSAHFVHRAAQQCPSPERPVSFPVLQALALLPSGFKCFEFAFRCRSYLSSSLSGCQRMVTSEHLLPFFTWRSSPASQLGDGAPIVLKATPWSACGVPKLYSLHLQAFRSELKTLHFLHPVLANTRVSRALISPQFQ